MPKFSDHMNAAKPPLFALGDIDRRATMDELQAAAERSVVTPLQASRDERLAPALRRVVRMAARCGLEIDPLSDKKLSIVAVDKALKEAKMSVSDRMDLKAALAAAGLIL